MAFIFAVSVYHRPAKHLSLHQQSQADYEDFFCAHTGTGSTRAEPEIEARHAHLHVLANAGIGI